jgi:hypothetical protein
MRQHKCQFKGLNLPDGGTKDEMTLQRLSGPSSQVTSWQVYDINGYTLYTNAKDKKSVSQNSIHIDAIDATDVTTTYFGFIEDIWKLDYGMGEGPKMATRGG